MSHIHNHEQEIRELLRDYQELGVRVVVFLEGFHVEGNVLHVGEHFLTLAHDVEIESNDTGDDLENPHRIFIKNQVNRRSQRRQGRLIPTCE